MIQGISNVQFCANDFQKVPEIISIPHFWSREVSSYLSVSLHSPQHAFEYICKPIVQPVQGSTRSTLHGY